MHYAHLLAAFFLSRNTRSRLYLPILERITIQLHSWEELQAYRTRSVQYRRK